MKPPRIVLDRLAPQRAPPLGVRRGLAGLGDVDWSAVDASSVDVDTGGAYVPPPAAHNYDVPLPPGESDYNVPLPPGYVPPTGNYEVHVQAGGSGPGASTWDTIANVLRALGTGAGTVVSAVGSRRPTGGSTSRGGTSTGSAGASTSGSSGASSPAGGAGYAVGGRDPTTTYIVAGVGGVALLMSLVAFARR